MSFTTDSLTTFQKERLERGECLESVYRGRSRGFGSSDCGKKIKPVEQGGDGYHCGQHVAMYAKRDADRQARQEQQAARRAEQQKVMQTLRFLGLTEVMVKGSRSVVLNIDALQKRFAEVFDAGVEEALLKQGQGSPENPYEVKP